MKRILAAVAITAAVLVPAAASARPVPQVKVSCPSSSLVTDVLAAQFDGYHERILWAWIDGRWQATCPF